MSTSPRPVVQVPVRLGPGSPGKRPQVALTALVRMAVRQHRTVLVLGVVVLAVLGVWTYEVTAQVAAARAHLAVANCAADYGSAACTDALDRAQSAVAAVLYLQWGLVCVPVLAGLFLGAPLVAGEFEQGTHRLAWSQSVSPQRWLRGNLLFACGAALLAGLAAAALGLWLHHVVTPAPGVTSGSFMPLPYNATGPVLAGAVLLAVALGALAGTLTRRTLPAMGATLVLYGAVVAALTWVRQYLLPTRTLLTDVGYNLAPDDWLLRDGVQLADGRRLLYAQCGPRGCPASAPTFEVYHPAGQLWPMQWTEAGLMLLLAVAALALAHRAVRRPRG